MSHPLPSNQPSAIVFNLIDFQFVLFTLSDFEYHNYVGNVEAGDTLFKHRN